jgi:hypothetical protein
MNGLSKILITLASLMISYHSFAMLNEIGSKTAEVTWNIGSHVVHAGSEVGAFTMGHGTMIVGKTLEGVDNALNQL